MLRLEKYKSTAQGSLRLWSDGVKSDSPLLFPLLRSPVPSPLSWEQRQERAGTGRKGQLARVGDVPQVGTILPWLRRPI